MILKRVDRRCYRDKKKLKMTFLKHKPKERKLNRAEHVIRMDNIRLVKVTGEGRNVKPGQDITNTGNKNVAEILKDRKNYGKNRVV